MPSNLGLICVWTNISVCVSTPVSVKKYWFEDSLNQINYSDNYYRKL